MSLGSILRIAVKIAKKVVDSGGDGVLVDVLHQRFIGRSKTSKPSHSGPTKRRAIFERKRRTWPTAQGDVIEATGVLTFLENLAVGNEDLMTLPDGEVLQVVEVGQLADPKGGGFLTQAWIGRWLSG